VPLHVAVLSGGTSLEREVSLRSGRRVADALGDRGHHVDLLDLDAQLVPRLTADRPDVVFLALHGAAGEDGTIQSMLEVLELPYTGPDVLASSLAWNKPIAQGVYRRAGCTVPRGVRLSQQAFRELGAGAMLGRLTEELGLPLVVKPATGGSSLGVTVVEHETSLAAAVLEAFSYADAVLLEQAVIGTEVAVGVLDGVPLPPVEIEPVDGIYDFAARYTAGATTFHVPARLPQDVLDACTANAVLAFQAIGARHVSRADLIVDADGTPWLLEIDTCPGLTDTSLLPLAAQAAGIDFGTLCERVTQLALPDGAA
jgi:D-alanine-D-alanine ligase